MAEGNGGSSNTAIVAIFVIIILAALLYFSGVLGPKGPGNTTVIEKPVIIEKPVKNN